MPAFSITPNILKSLHYPSAFPVHTETVELLQTHVSWIFLTDTHVFKIKKPINLGFLNFSTLELRHFYCLEELRLNRRLCLDVYEQVIELHETENGASFVGDGKVIDYAVMMKRLPTDRMLDRLVDSGAISTADICLIADKISVFHSTAPTSQHISHFGSLEEIRFNWEENFKQTVQFTTSTLPESVRENIHLYVKNFTRSHRNLFDMRVENGYIRECDGDIHLGNICLADNKAYIFDCIEFNERFRYSDTAADIAFLLMDLDFHGRPDLAEAAQSEYIKVSGDANCAKIIPFYKVYRAYIRGKVESFELLDSGITLEVRLNAEKRAIRYFRLAQGYCLRKLIPPTLFITSGTMGCGKSTMAGQLAFELDLSLFSSDVARKRLAGISPETAVQVPFKKGIYSNEMSVETYRQLEKLSTTELASGRSVVVDAGFGRRVERERFARVASANNAQFVILYVECPPDEQQRRLYERSFDKTAISDGRVELLNQQITLFEAADNSESNIFKINSGGDLFGSLDSLYERLLQS